ncbi:UBP1-associated protein 2C-like isoform X2 [Salvia miltiorrhiza]|uniref:UBP1-associated protein 2C-like n=1 Tax=Salvia miltiorrhiza TaxID=226208 RepID=UPI0025AD64C2|nr:UBP1-associated protein 2C-like [Salvia miltiorrhiza]XP_057768796.1 UBP1-associated protein 2C-like [Salvia miltiorrhiza]XP_057768842.1 UBP1-associated protein 2C-like isoform X2 [Salvia miltiorrhiza]XP_057768843.1 UBP1-associated protein 2C-like isoform X2 [Salvia miltiorrhiza]XP_057768844.1 UBP1-associated protein 2C-like isoform X2 [Salvia miltiorrhiza]
MEDLKKRKLDEMGNGEVLPNSNDSTANSTTEELRALLDPLAKPQLVDILARAGSQYPSIAEEIKSVASADPALRKLFVRGLAWNTTSETLCAAFLEHGEIEEGAVIYDKVTGKSRGYGFVTFKDMESAQTALKAPSKMIDGRMAVCNLASEGLSSNSITPDQAQRKLYVGGLSPETTSEMLLAFFSRHGEIEEGSVAYDKDTNKSRGFGFVTYKTVEAAKKAIDDPQKLLGGRNITVKLADNYKGKVSQSQLPQSAVPLPVHMNGGAPMGYAYPQPMATYPTAPYTSPPTAAAPPYAVHPQYSYPQYGVKKETPPQQTAIGGYPSYYMPKQ